MSDVISMWSHSQLDVHAKHDDDDNTVLCLALLSEQELLSYTNVEKER